jgi:hypothetical protein
VWVDYAIYLTNGVVLVSLIGLVLALLEAVGLGRPGSSSWVCWLLAWWRLL